MIKKEIKILLLAAILVSFLVNSAFALVKVGEIINLVGRVNILRQGKFPAIKAKVGEAIFKGDIIRTKSRSKVQIRLVDGSIIKIGPRSRVDVVQYLKNAGKYKAIFKLRRGIMGAYVNEKEVKVIKENPEANKFEVHTPIAVAGVRGTDFIVRQLPQMSSILVLKGRVYVYNPRFPEKVVELHTNQFTIVKPFVPPAPPKKVSPIQRKEQEKDITLSQKISKSIPQVKSVAKKIKQVITPVAIEASTTVISTHQVTTQTLNEIAEIGPAIKTLETSTTSPTEDLTYIPITQTSEVAETLAQELEQLGITSFTLTGITPRVYPPGITLGLSLTTTNPSILTYELTNSTQVIDSGISDTLSTSHNFTITIPYSVVNQLLNLKVVANDTQGNSIDKYIEFVPYFVSFGGKALLNGDLSNISGEITGLVQTGGNVNFENTSKGEFVIFTSNPPQEAGNYDTTNKEYWLLKTKTSGIVDKFVFLSTNSPKVAFIGNDVKLNINLLLTSTTSSPEIKTLEINRDYFTAQGELFYNGTVYFNPYNATLNSKFTLALTPKNFGIGFIDYTNSSFLSSSGMVWIDPLFGGAARILPSNTTDYHFNVIVSKVVKDNDSNSTGFLLGELGDTLENSAVLTQIPYAEAEGNLTYIPLLNGTNYLESYILLYPDSLQFLSGSVSQGLFNSTTLKAKDMYLTLFNQGDNEIGEVSLGIAGKLLSIPSNKDWYALYKFYSTGNLYGVLKFNGEAFGNETISDATLLNSIKAKTTGSYLELSESTPTTGIIVGETIGTFDPSSKNFQIATVGRAISTKMYLNMIDSGQTDKLQELGIPVVEVGRVTLSGSTPDGSLSVTMNNVRFFTSQAGTPPSIWATNDVTGSFSETVSTGTTVTLSGGSISNLEFKLIHWDTTNGKWGAEISKGTNFAGSIGTYTIKDIHGFAGGKIDTTTGKFTGTASGVVDAQ
ncbi:MAG: hypothetical protein GXO57_04190 [Thermodesulfobacteria bacterium]|nr:hypothetical protein [Thermodesulfobacteriota bacterium]